MTTNITLPWTYDLDQAIRLQENLSKRVLLTWDNRPVNTVAGVDVSYTTDSVRAAISLFQYPEIDHLTTAVGEASQTFPYIPGLLAFRAGPAILEAWEKLKMAPDLIMIHGHGIAHPRHFGLASHVGLWLNLPTIGIARARLYGNCAEVGPQVGDWGEIRDEKKPETVIGAALRTQANTKPIFVSPGHLIDLGHAIEFVLACCQAYRMPEPLRSASQIASNSLLIT
jgi:deoxyribonuclease V